VSEQFFCGGGGGIDGGGGAWGQLFWDRALSFPLERPKSLTPEWIENYCKNKAKKK